MKKMILALGLWLLLLVPSLAQASLVTYNFSGVVTRALNFAGFSEGQTFTGTFTYNTDTVVSGAGGEIIYKTPLDLQITAGGVTYAPLAALKYLPNLYDLTYTEYAGGAQGFGLFAEGVYDATSTPAPGQTNTYKEIATLELLFPKAPSPMIPAINYVYHLRENEFGQPLVSQDALLEATITGVSEAAPTPIPAAVWLLGTGLAGLAGARKLRRRQ